jgi:hypothetical protein
MFAETTLHPDSLLGRLRRKAPITNTAAEVPPRQIPFLRWESSSGRKIATTATIVSVDNGNDAFKGAMLHAHAPRLCTKRIVTAYAPEQKLGAGDGLTTWQVNESEAFWIGEEALQATKAESLPIGMTEDRLPDERYRCYLFACLVELLVEAGYGDASREVQGEYDLYLSFGVPNEEVSRGGISEAVRRALTPLFNTAYTIRRTDEHERVTTWVLRLVELNPYPQTFGSFVAWYYTLDGAPVETDITKHLTLDIGGGQFHQCEVTLQHQLQGPPKLRMAASLVDEGTIGIARAVREQLRAQHPGLRLSDVEAQQALKHQQTLIDGRQTKINEIVSEVIAARSPKLLTHLRHQLQDERSFLMFTGGGSILLEPSLRELVGVSRRTQSFLFVPQELSPVLNAIGGYILAQATAQKVVTRMQATTTPGRDTQ